MKTLTRAGLEVEEVTNRAKDFNHVVVGHILEKDKHPNADKLSLCPCFPLAKVLFIKSCVVHKTTKQVIESSWLCRVRSCREILRSKKPPFAE